MRNEAGKVCLPRLVVLVDYFDNVGLAERAINGFLEQIKQMKRDKIRSRLGKKNGFYRQASAQSVFKIH